MWCLRRYVAEGGDWRKSYYTPTRADAAIVAMRKWMESHAGGGIPFPEHLQVCGVALRWWQYRAPRRSKRLHCCLPGAQSNVLCNASLAGPESM